MSAEMKNQIKGRPEITTATETSDGAVSLAWKETVGVQKYIVEKFDRETQRFFRYAALDAETRTFLDTDVEPGTIYRYRIAAKRKNPDGEVLVRRGSIVSVALTSKDSVRLLKAEHPAFGVAKLAWEGAENVDGYRINRRNATISKPLPLAYVDSKSTTFVDRSCVSGQIYFYSVQSFRQSDAEDDPVFSQNGNELMIVNLDVPEILAKKKRGSTVEFQLRITAGADGYVLLRSDSEDGPFIEVARTKKITDLKLTDKGGRSHGGSYYAVACVNQFDGEEYLGPKSKVLHI